MFTGIIEEKGEVLVAPPPRLVIGCRTVSADAPIGASLAVNGVCLTVVAGDDGSLAFDVSPETLDRTSLGRLGAGHAVNLERPVTLVTRLGGHLVQGHVDAVGQVAAVEPDGSGGVRLRLLVPPELRRYVVEKGSIGVDGVSLTVAAEDANAITIALIPHTLAATTLGEAAVGDPVNIEVDIIAKYVARNLAYREAGTGTQNETTSENEHMEGSWTSPSS